MKKNMMRSTGMIFATFNAVWLLAGAGAGTSRAADYLGATAVLQAVEARHAKSDLKSAETNESARLSADLKTFRQTAGTLPPTEAAQRWLELADRTIKVQSQAGSRRNYYYDSENHNELLEALPPPADWGELAKAVAARPPAKGDAEMRELGLQLLCALLTSDTNKQSQAFARLSAKARAADPQTADVYANYLRQIGQIMMKASDNPDAILQMLNNQVDTASPQNPQPITVPNLVAQVGAEKAEVFLRRALLKPSVMLQFNQANATSRLAQKLALELLPQLKAPHWELINSLDAVNLYEAMDRQFSSPTNGPAAAASVPGLPGIPNLPGEAEGMDNFTKPQAQIYYMLGLISQNRTADAVAAAKKISTRNNEYIYAEAFKEMEHAGYTEALDDFFHELLAQNPALPFWDQYVELAAHAGKTERMVALVHSTLDHGDMSDSQKAGLQQILFKALLAADNVDEAVAEIRRLANQDMGTRSGRNFDAGQLGVILARLGFLLQKPDLTEEGLGITKQWLAKHAGDSESGRGSTDVVGGMAQILMDLHRGPEAEALLTDALAATVAGAPAGSASWENSGVTSILVDLAALYHQAGRYEDVLHLLEQSPGWGVGDLGGIMGYVPDEIPVPVMFLHTGSSPLPLSYLAANALLATGRKEAAQKILGPLQDYYPGLDRCYELLIALQGTNAIPQLDAWFQRDQFEERPLIWKAHLLRQENRLEEAEKTIRQAIAIDPSDGEEGRGDRMRAYTELSEIRAARGDQKEAGFYGEVVKAIRLSEDADQFYQVGLLKRAIPMYKEALNHFADAYCIQSRLAIQLSEMGKNEEAEEHYRRAYELMPDSFGRVESHCFGCEKAFDGERAQSIAEKVFTKFLMEHPGKPQVHYLLGYLRGEQERYNEACANYRVAVRLDPDYLNAWVKLSEASREVLVPARERDEIALNILRLDPLRRHAQVTFENVGDLAGLWNAAAFAAARQSAPVTNLFLLSASKLALEKKSEESRGGEMMRDIQRFQDDYRERLAPASMIAQTSLVQLAGQMIMYNSGAEY